MRESHFRLGDIHGHVGTLQIQIALMNAERLPISRGFHFGTQPPLVELGLRLSGLDARAKKEGDLDRGPDLRVVLLELGKVLVEVAVLGEEIVLCNKVDAGQFLGCGTFDLQGLGPVVGFEAAQFGAPFQGRADGGFLRCGHIGKDGLRGCHENSVGGGIAEDHRQVVLQGVLF